MLLVLLYFSAPLFTVDPNPEKLARQYFISAKLVIGRFSASVIISYILGNNRFNMVNHSVHNSNYYHEILYMGVFEIRSYGYRVEFCKISEVEHYEYEERLSTKRQLQPRNSLRMGFLKERILKSVINHFSKICYRLLVFDQYQYLYSKIKYFFCLPFFFNSGLLGRCMILKQVKK